MLNQSNEKGFFASNVVVPNVKKEAFDAFEVARTGKLVNERRVRWVVVFETHFAIVVEEREGFIWVFKLFEVGDERYWFAKKIWWWFVMRLLAARTRSGSVVGTTKSVVR